MNFINHKILTKYEHVCCKRLQKPCQNDAYAENTV